MPRLEPDEMERLRITLLRSRKYSDVAHTLFIEKDMNGTEQAAKLSLENLREAMSLIIKYQDSDESD